MVEGLVRRSADLYQRVRRDRFLASLICGEGLRPISRIDGRLDVPADDPPRLALKSAACHVSAILALETDRPAILTNIQPFAQAILGQFRL
ncbi:hypothetical protein [Sphingopyxis terrae]|uniref:hypothetical protein n=1 Tax=Sphingopyxis terrae TaxID=33052 RepID=UPI002A155060|nr:hypothetical protein [Sphingopyxis terrae]MDX8356456.1 hypothetical protein [Sphingopyxis terrae]